MSENFFSWINDGVQLLLTNSGDPLLVVGMYWFQVIAAVMIMFHGSRIALAIKGGAPVGLTGIIRYLALLAVCFTLLKFYNMPAPFFDNTFHGYVTGMGADLANRIDLSMTERLTEKFNEVILGMETPAWYDLSAIGAHIHYYFCVFTLSAMQSVMICVIGFGWVATGVIVLFGPVFIPCMVLPKCEQWFWSWLSSLFQFTFYTPVASAFVYIFSHVFLKFFDFYPPPYDAPKLASMFLVVASLGLAMIFGCFKVTGLVADLFRGSSGAHTMPGVGWWRG